jgi:hypothetical protein
MERSVGIDAKPRMCTYLSANGRARRCVERGSNYTTQTTLLIHGKPLLIHGKPTHEIAHARDRHRHGLLGVFGAAGEEADHRLGEREEDACHHRSKHLAAQVTLPSHVTKSRYQVTVPTRVGAGGGNTVVMKKETATTRRAPPGSRRAIALASSVVVATARKLARYVTWRTRRVHLVRGEGRDVST